MTISAGADSVHLWGAMDSLGIHARSGKERTPTDSISSVPERSGVGGIGHGVCGGKARSLLSQMDVNRGRGS